MANKTIKMQYKGLSYKENKDGTFTVSATCAITGKVWTVTEKTFANATNFLCEMAPNRTLGNKFIERICNKRNCDAFSLS